MNAQQLKRNLRLLLALAVLQSTNLFSNFLTRYLHDIHHFSWGTTVKIGYGLIVLLAAYQLPTGYLADRFGRKRALYVGCFCTCIGPTLYAVMPGWWVLLGGVVTAFGWSFQDGADTGIANNTCRALYGASQQATKRYEAYANELSGFISLGLFFGVLLGAGLVWQFGLRGPFWGQGVVYAASLGLIICIKEPPAERAPGPRRVFGRLARNKLALSLIATSAAFVLFTSSVFTLLPQYYALIRVGGHHLPAQGFGLVMAIWFCYGWFVKWVSRRLRNADRLPSPFWLIALGLGCYITLGLTNSLAGLGAILGLAFIGPFYQPGLAAQLRNAVPHTDLSTARSAQRLAQSAVLGTCGMIAGWVAGEYGLSIGFWSLAASCGALSTLALVVLSRVARSNLGEPQPLPLPVAQESRHLPPPLNSRP